MTNTSKVQQPVPATASGQAFESAVGRMATAVARVSAPRRFWS